MAAASPRKARRLILLLGNRTVVVSRRAVLPFLTRKNVLVVNSSSGTPKRAVLLAKKPALFAFLGGNDDAPTPAGMLMAPSYMAPKLASNLPWKSLPPSSGGGHSASSAAERDEDARNLGGLQSVGPSYSVAPHYDAFRCYSGFMVRELGEGPGRAPGMSNVWVTVPNSGAPRTHFHEMWNLYRSTHCAGRLRFSRAPPVSSLRAQVLELSYAARERQLPGTLTRFPNYLVGLLGMRRSAEHSWVVSGARSLARTLSPWFRWKNTDSFM